MKRSNTGSTIGSARPLRGAALRAANLKDQPMEGFVREDAKRKAQEAAARAETDRAMRPIR